jgi:hypothetical protein
MLNVIMLSVVMLSVIKLSVVMLSVVMLSVIMLSVVMLSVVAPLPRLPKATQQKGILFFLLVWTGQFPWNSKAWNTN